MNIATKIVQLCGLKGPYKDDNQLGDALALGFDSADKEEIKSMFCLLASRELSNSDNVSLVDYQKHLASSSSPKG
jgi:hypothetical protein